MADDDVADALRERLARYMSDGDPGVILAPEAVREAAALRASVGWPAFGRPLSGAAIRRELDAVVVAGMFHYVRYQELAIADRVDALLAAMELFTAVYPFAPAAVPEAMRVMCAVLAGNPPDMNHAELHNEAIDTLDAAEVSRDRAEVDQGIWLTAAAFLAARDDRDRARHLSVLGTAWLQRFRITGRTADLDNSVTAHQRALALDSSAMADQAGHRANLSAALLTRYENTGSLADLGEAVAAARAATEIARTSTARPPAAWPRGPGPDPVLAIRYAARTSQSGLAGALLRRYLYGRDLADLDEAIIAGREAVAAAPPGDPARPGSQANLANLLLERFTRTWQEADLSEGATSARAAVTGAADDDPARAVALSALGLAHAGRFAYSGDMSELDRAIDATRDAVAVAGGDPPGAAACLSSLGAALHTRYQRTGDTGALDEAITVLRQAVHAAPATHVSRPGYLNNLGNALRSRFEAGRPASDLAYLAESAAVLIRAVDEARPRAPDRAGYAANLASALILAARYAAYPDALDRAISVLDRELRAAGNDHPLRHTFLGSLGQAWLARFDASGGDRALDLAIAYLRQAVSAVPARHPQRAEHLAALGNALRSKAERPGGSAEAAAAEAIEASRAAAEIVTAPPLNRALAARDWGQTAAMTRDAAEALRGLSAAVNLLDQVGWRGLKRGDQERNLGRFTALACDAAAWALEAGEPRRALELLEQGRGVLLAQSLGHRARYDDLRRADPALADSLERVDRELGHVPSAGDPLLAAGPGPADSRLRLARQRDALLARVRELAGFADFLKPPAFASLRAAAAPGPVVVVNVSAYRCDALIVTADGVQVTRLPGLTGADVVTHVTEFLTAVTAGKAIEGTLAWLWDAVAAPVLPVLKAACGGAGDERPRVWWCPTGPLTFVPLHAAGRHDGSGEAFADHFISSYIPTLRLLLRARRPLDRATGSGAPLVVALPETPGQPPLPNAAVEADDFMAQFGDATQLRGGGATVSAVTDALGQSPRVAHFACQGMQDIADPASGHLRLYDGPLGITGIAGLRLEPAELAYLSACETSMSSVHLSDEAITLATAFRLAGCQHVIGTLWPVRDRLAPGVAGDVYRQLRLHGTGGAAAALDTATASLRNERRADPRLWASYIHIGP